MTRIRLGVKENVLSDPARVTQQMYQDYLQLLGRGWVCCSDGRVVGFAFASTMDASIWALFVEPAFEGRGIARRLLAFAVDWLFGLGHPAVVLSTGRGTRAERFYTAGGWIPTHAAGARDIQFTRLAPPH